MELDVETIGARGDGIARYQGRPVYIPFGLPGEKLLVEYVGRQGDGQKGRIREILSPSPERVTPPCPHFEKCGGCALQHLNPAAIAREKRNILARAMSRKGFGTIEIGETLSAPPASRRRIRLAFLRLRKRVLLGFNERSGKTIVDINTCPVSDPALVALFSPLRTLCAKLPALGKAADIQITLCDNGPDLTFYPQVPKDLALAERFDLADFAEAHGLARIAIEYRGFSEPVVARHDVKVSFGQSAVALPAGAFLQPSKQGEQIIAGLLVGAVEGARKIADLYAGCGSLTFPMAETPDHPAIHAVEGSGVQINALRKAIGGKRISTEIRDLAKNPLDVPTLAKFDAVVFDPPRTGARPQSHKLAASNVPLVIAVSCNPSTLARDLRILVDGGYQIDRLIPIDQFTWSGHVEAFAILRRRRQGCLQSADKPRPASPRAAP